MKKYIMITINQTSKTNPQDHGGGYIFNTEKEYFGTIEEAKNFLLEYYDIKTLPKKYIYRDNEQGEAKKVGYIKNYWNKDFSHDSKKWYQTDWIEIKEVKEKTILFTN